MAPRHLAYLAMATFGAMIVIGNVVVYNRIPEIENNMVGRRGRIRLSSPFPHHATSDTHTDSAPNKNPFTRAQPPNQKKDSPVNYLLQNPLFQGKERLLSILDGAHYFDDASIHDYQQDPAKVQELADHLPSWEQVSDRLGGDEPFIVGLDTCEDFQQRVPATERVIGVAGLFATGTNLLAELLIANCKIQTRMEKYGKQSHGVRWQANWGKHQPAQYRLSNKLDPELHNEEYLPIVTIRHPYSWMQSMCRQRYSTHWFHNAQEHCPNLVPNDVDRYWYNMTLAKKIRALYKDPWLYDNMNDLANFTLDATVVPVRVRFKSGTHFHTSLAHFWNDWYHQYVDDARETKFPRVIVRLEDLTVHAEEVITKVCECAGGVMNPKFKYVAETAKKGSDKIHGKDRTNLFKSLTHIRTENRTKGMTLEDQQYAREHYDPELLDMFGYHIPSTDGLGNYEST